MVTCSVINCKNTSTNTSRDKDGISFHRFPKDKERAKKWEVAINREKDWTSSSGSAVCSEHFDVKDFYLTDRGLRKLALRAVPVHNISPCQPPAPTIKVVNPVDVLPTDTEEIIKLKYTVRRLQEISENRKKRLYVMWQGKRKLQKKLNKMKSVIKHLIRHSEIQKIIGS